MNEVTRQLKARKSVRVFEDAAVPPEILDEILDCAFAAPTAGCQMLYTILHITDQAKKDALSALCDNQPFIARAPVVLVFLADCRRWLDAYRLAGVDAPPPREADLLLACADAFIAAQNAVTAAQSLGLGSCYIGDVWENREKISELLALDEFTFPATLLVLGYPTEQQKKREKPRRFDRHFLVFENAYRPLTETEQRAMFENQGDEDLEKTLPEFCRRKYMSEFANEMRRSVAEYLRGFRRA
ncbi:MAG: nitroreductase family protein [Oscillospiraceae bacterium]|jgi:nitroreductase|nr:nitroreductase family protein [Oscillospiraceae bacterium]